MEMWAYLFVVSEVALVVDFDCFVGTSSYLLFQPETNLEKMFPDQLVQDP